MKSWLEASLKQGIANDREVEGYFGATTTIQAKENRPPPLWELGYVLGRHLLLLGRPRAMGQQGIERSE